MREIGPRHGYTSAFRAVFTPPPGAIAQLGERLDRTQEVGGSSPPSSINQINQIKKSLAFAGLFCWPSVLRVILGAPQLASVDQLRRLSLWRRT
jgi:hypothetical protein